MSSQPIPYRDTNNQTVGYVAANSIAEPVQTSPYDSDFEPLITNHGLNNAGQQLDDDSIMRFTATGRPIPTYKPSSLQSMAGDMFSLPQLLPKRYTDDSIIPAIVMDVIPSQKTIDEGKKKSRRGTFMKKLKGEPKEDESKGLTKVVYMPRRDYLKWFARDVKGNYTGSEPYKKWEEEELEETFRQYKPVVTQKKGYTAPN